MERSIMQDLIAWKIEKIGNLLFYLQREFENIAYINCDNNAMVKDLLAHPINLGGTAKTCPLTDTHRFPMIILSHIKHKPR